MTIRSTIRRQHGLQNTIAVSLVLFGSPAVAQRSATGRTTLTSCFPRRHPLRRSSFTIPQDQMSHVQVVTVEPTTIERAHIRLTGAVAYNNAFATFTPVITQVGGPVSRILAVPPDNVSRQASLCWK